MDAGVFRRTWALHGGLDHAIEAVRGLQRISSNHVQLARLETGLQAASAHRGSKKSAAGSGKTAGLSVEGVQAI